MKIAAVSDDGVTISRHFGRAQFYVVVTVEDRKIVSREKREKLGHAHFAGEHGAHGSQNDPRGHGFDPTAQDRHARMAASISDCQVLLVGGMGMGAYESMQQANIIPLVTDLENIDEAVQAYLSGSLKHHGERLH